MKSRALSVPWGLFALELCMAAVYLLLLLTDRAALANTYGPPGLVEFVILALAFVGSLLVARVPGNRVGWILILTALDLNLTVIVQLYPSRAASLHLPGAVQGAWLGQWLFLPAVLSLITFLVLLFPDGRLPTSWWRWPARLVGLVVVASTAAWALDTFPVAGQLRASAHGAVTGGAVSGSLAPAVRTLESLGYLAGLVCIAAPVQRFRSADSIVRHQIKWLVLAMALLVAATATFPIAAILAGTASPPDWTATVFELALAGIPISVGFAVLKYRLYDIDLVISRTLVYGSLAALSPRSTWASWWG